MSVSIGSAEMLKNILWKFHDVLKKYFLSFGQQNYYSVYKHIFNNILITSVHILC